MYFKNIKWLIVTIAGIIVTSCAISYKFNDASIDYSMVSTITVRDFPNQSALTSPTLSSVFTESLQDAYLRKTKLQMVPNNGDLEVEGEITGYTLTPLAVQEDAYSSRTKLTISVRVRYYNRANPDEDFEQTFSAYTDFDSNEMLQTIQESVDAIIVEELVDQIFNATVANW